MPGNSSSDSGKKALGVVGAAFGIGLGLFYYFGYKKSKNQNLSQASADNNSDMRATGRDDNSQNTRDSHNTHIQFGAEPKQIVDLQIQVEKELQLLLQMQAKLDQAGIDNKEFRESMIRNIALLSEASKKLGMELTNVQTEIRDNKELLEAIQKDMLQIHIQLENIKVESKSVKEKVEIIIESQTKILHNQDIVLENQKEIIQGQKEIIKHSKQLHVAIKALIALISGLSVLGGGYLYLKPQNKSTPMPMN